MPGAAPRRSACSRRSARPARGRSGSTSTTCAENYAFAFDGTFNGNPAAAVGRFHADGNGHLLAGARTLSVGAAVPFQQTFTCDYVVNADGTGTADCLTVPGILVPAGDEESFAFVLLNHGRRAYFIATTPGAVLRGTTERH